MPSHIYISFSTHISQLSPDFPFGLYEPDMDIVSDLLQEAAIRVPALEKTGIKSTVYGPESFTPDNKPIVGQSSTRPQPVNPSTVPSHSVYRVARIQLFPLSQENLSLFLSTVTTNFL